MKKLVVIGLAVFGLAMGASAQSAVYINNYNANGYLSSGATAAAATYYTGTAGFELWAAPSSANLSGINISAVPGYSSVAYSALSAAGFTKVTTVAGSSVSGGIFSGGTAYIPTSVSAAGSSMALALVAWTGSDASFSAAAADPSAMAGVEAFVNPTVDSQATPPPVPPGLDNMANDLVMLPVPEPSSLALAGLGAAALLIIRRRK